MNLHSFKQLDSATSKYKYCNKILAKYKQKILEELEQKNKTIHGVELDDEDLKIMFHVLSMHPDSFKMINAKTIFVKRSKKSARYTRFPQYCFHVLYEDGRVDDFSLKSCLYDITKETQDYAKCITVDIPKNYQDILIKEGLEPIPTNIVNVEQDSINMNTISKLHKGDCCVYFLWKNSQIYYVGYSGNHINRILLYEHDKIPRPDKTYYCYIRYDCEDVARKSETKYISTIRSNKMYPIINCHA